MANNINFIFVIIFVILFNFTNLCSSENVKKSLDDNRDDNDSGDEGIVESLEIQADSSETIASTNCSARRDNGLVHETRQAQVKQFPFMAALFSQQNEYVCAGAIIANGLILTAAHCLSPSPSYVMINAIKDRKDNSSVTLHITKTEKFPTYQGGEGDKDVGLVYTEKHNASVGSMISLSNYTDVQNIIEFIALGYGLNTETNQLKELQYVGLENRRPPMNAGDLVHGIIDCVEIKVLTCFRDTGGPAIFDDQLIGVVFKGQSTCTQEMSSKYAVNKHMVTVIPTYTFKNWVDEKIKMVNQDSGPVIPIFPLKPVAADLKALNTRRSSADKNSIQIYIYLVSACIVLYSYLPKN